MYNDYFGLREKPFNVTPDPRFLFANAGYQEAYANLFYGIRERKGFTVLTGEVGTGKTTLLRRVMDNLEDAIRFVFFYNTTLSFEELLDHIFVELQLSQPSTGSRLQKIHALNQFLISQLAQGGTVALLIDEAQNLSDEVLENLRLLSNLETAQEKLLQIVLVGQPELETKLSQPHLRQLKQRIVMWCRLNHLKDNEVGAFIFHRLRTAGYAGPPLFTAGAVQRISAYSQGIPRLINVICDNALLLAYASTQKEISAELIEEAARDLQLLPVSRRLLFAETPHSRTQSAPFPLPLYEQTSPTAPSLPLIRRQEETKTPPRTASAATQELRMAPWVSHTSFRQQGFRLAASLLLLLGVGATALAFLKGPTIVSALPESVAPFVQALNGKLSSLFLPIMGLRQETPSQLPVAAQQEKPGEIVEASTAEASMPAGEREATENAPFAQEPVALDRPPDTAASVTPTALVPSNQSAVVILDNKRLPEESAQPMPVAPVQSPPPSPILRLREELPQTVRLQLGATILDLVRQIYGNYNTLALVLIKDFNPRIADLDEVAAGETVWLPPLSQETLLREQPDGSYRLIMAAFLTAASAQKLVKTMSRRGYTVEIAPYQVAGSLRLQRVEIVGLPNREAGQQAWQFVDTSNGLTTAPPAEKGNQTNQPIPQG